MSRGALCVAVVQGEMVKNSFLESLGDTCTKEFCKHELDESVTFHLLAATLYQILNLIFFYHENNIQNEIPSNLSRSKMCR